MTAEDEASTPEPDAKEEPEPTERADEAPEAPEPPVEETADDHEAEEEQQITQQVINFFHGDVSVGESGTVGFAVGEKVNRETGPVVEADVTRLRAQYFRTKTHHEAESELKREHLLILVGPEGSGRAAAALTLAALMREWTGVGGTLTRLPPTRTLDELCRYKDKYKPGRAYLVNDWVHGKVARGVQADYEVKRLAQILLDAEAYLVITAVRGSQDGEGTHGYEVEWSTPDPGELFDHCVERMGEDAAPFEADLPALRTRAVQLPSARRVVELVRRLRLRGVEEALADDEERDRQDVQGWFDQKPTRRALRAAAVLTLACRTGDEGREQPGVTQRGFELLFAALEAAEAEFRQDPPSDEGAPPEDEEFPQVRHGLLDYAKLTKFAVDQPTAASVGAEHAPGFKTARLRALFLAELHLRCGDELWSPLRLCLGNLAEDPDVGIEVLHALACGVGRMARHETRRVLDEYLDGIWASGRLTARECAVYALWSMAAEDELAPLALSLVGGWVGNRGEERAITAALALGGPLGKRYPSQAMWLLWELALRGARISIYARLAIAWLIQVQAQSHEANLANGLTQKVRPLMARNADVTTRRAALRVIADVLAVPGADAAPGVVDVLRQCPEAVRPLGELWADVLLSAPHRASGVRTLRRALDAFESNPNGVELATALGAEILPRLSPGHRRQVEVGLYAAEELRDRRVVRVTLRAFLDAMGTAPTTSESGQAELPRK